MYIISHEPMRIAYDVRVNVSCQNMMLAVMLAASEGCKKSLCQK